MPNRQLLTPVPEVHREAAGDALDAAFGRSGVTAVEPVVGGASGALTYKVAATTGAHLLRIETIRGPLRNPHQTACLLAAADAGIAPPVRHADDEAGTLVVQWIDQVPPTEHPGGPAGLASEAGALVARLHAVEPTFPSTGDHLEKLGQLLDGLTASGRVAPGLLDGHRAALAEIVAAYPWAPGTFVSCHNDPNPSNLLYDGHRLWLVDWETAGRNDPAIDLAALCAHLAPTPELEDVLLRAWLGQEPDDVLRAKLVLAGQLNRLFAGSILLLVVPDPSTPVHHDLSAVPLQLLADRVASGELVPGEPATSIAFAKSVLADFLERMAAPATTNALDVARRARS